MTTSLPRRFAGLGLLLLPFVPSVAAAPEAEIARLVKQLGDDEFEKREDATTRLKEIGEPALDALHKATTSSDPEVRCRARDLVAAIEDKLYGPELCLTGHTGHVWNVSVSADGKRLLTSGDDRTLRLWDADTGKQLRVFEGHAGRIVGAALSADGKRVLSGGGDGTVRQWDADTGKQLHEMKGHTDEVLSVAFGPEGKAISGATDRAVRLWDLNMGKKAGVFAGHTGRVRDVAYSEKARLAATCNDYDPPIDPTTARDFCIRLWDLETGKEVRRLVGHSLDVESVCFSPDGKSLLSASCDGTLRLWDVGSGKELKRIRVERAFRAAFSPNGRRVVCCNDGIVRVCDVETGKELRRYEGHTGGVSSVVFFPDGKRIASASLDGTVRIWRAPR